MPEKLTNIAEIAEFTDEIEARKYADKYINEDLPYLIENCEISGVTNVRIIKKLYDKIEKGCYKYFSEEVIFDKKLD